MKLLKFFFSLVANLLLSSAFAQEAETLPPLHFPLTPVPADSVKTGDFFWNLQMKEVDKTVPKTKITSNNSEKTISINEWEKLFATLGIEGGINNDKDDVVTISEFAKQCGKLVRETGDGRYASAMEHCYFNGLAGRMNDTDINKREAAAASLRQLPGEMMATSGKHLFINMFTRSQTHIKTKDIDIEAIITTSTPWFNENWIEILTGGHKQHVTLHLKVPEWLQKDFLNGYDMNNKRSQINVFVKGRKIAPRVDKGYVVIDREWEDSTTTIVLQYPTPIRRVTSQSHPNGIILMKGGLLYSFLNVPDGMYIKESDPIRSDFDKDRHTNVLSAPYYTSTGEKAGIYLAEPYLFNRRNPQSKIFMPVIK